jgi:hypothetical protein
MQVEEQDEIDEGEYGEERRKQQRGKKDVACIG